jgi:hypothetical protein
LVQFELFISITLSWVSCQSTYFYENYCR